MYGEQSGGWNAVCIAPLLTFCQWWMEGNVLLCSCIYMCVEPFQHYKVSKIELGLSLHFQPSLTQLTPLPYLAFVFFTLARPNPYSFCLLPGTLSQIDYIAFSTWEFLTLSDEKIPPSTEGNFICPKASHIPQEESISCFLSN